MKVIFVGQPLYYGDHYSAFFEYGYSGPISASEVRYIHGVVPPEMLLDLKADVIVVFRGEYIPAEILKTWNGTTVHIASEPMPRLRADGQIEISNDRSMRFSEFLEAKGKYNFTYLCDGTSRTYAERMGMKIDGEFILPVEYSLKSPHSVPDWDVLFYGRETTHRARLLREIKHALGEKFCQIAHGFYGENLFEVMDNATIGLNLHVDDFPAQEPRLQQMMNAGLLVLSEPLPTQSLFKAGKHYVEINGAADLYGKVLYYLENPSEAQAIANEGRKMVHQKLDATEVWAELFLAVLNGKTYNPPTTDEIKSGRKRH